jgi:hypothetical protein
VQLGRLLIGIGQEGEIDTPAHEVEAERIDPKDAVDNIEPAFGLVYFNVNAFHVFEQHIEIEVELLEHLKGNWHLVEYNSLRRLLQDTFRCGLMRIGLWHEAHIGEAEKRRIELGAQ